jgi:hypothetical protein
MRICHAVTNVAHVKISPDRVVVVHRVTNLVSVLASGPFGSAARGHGDGYTPHGWVAARGSPGIVHIAAETSPALPVNDRAIKDRGGAALCPPLLPPFEAGFRGVSAKAPYIVPIPPAHPPSGGRSAGRDVIVPRLGGISNHSTAVWKQFWVDRNLRSG